MMKILPGRCRKNKYKTLIYMIYRSLFIIMSFTLILEVAIYEIVTDKKYVASNNNSNSDKDIPC